MILKNLIFYFLSVVVVSPLASSIICIKCDNCSDFTQVIECPSRNFCYTLSLNGVVKKNCEYRRTNLDICSDNRCSCSTDLCNDDEGPIIQCHVCDNCSLDQIGDLEKCPKGARGCYSALLRENKFSKGCSVKTNGSNDFMGIIYYYCSGESCIKNFNPELSSTSSTRKLYTTQISTTLKTITTTKICGKGYEGRFNSTECVDVDECGEGLSKCDSNSTDSCVNTEGSYECKCRQGFSRINREVCQVSIPAIKSKLGGIIGGVIVGLAFLLVISSVLIFLFCKFKLRKKTDTATLSAEGVYEEPKEISEKSEDLYKETNKYEEIYNNYETNNEMNNNNNEHVYDLYNYYRISETKSRGNDGYKKTINIQKEKINNDDNYNKIKKNDEYE